MIKPIRRTLSLAAVSAVFLASYAITTAQTTWTTLSSTTNATHSEGAAVTLASGRVLITGGAGLGQILASPLTTTFEADGTKALVSPSMAVARRRHTATLLANGHVLVVGGQDPSNAALAGGEIYNPSPAGWTTLPADPVNPLVPRAGHVAVRLDDGFVLLAGGEAGGEALASVARVTEGGGTGVPSTLQSARTNLAAATLADGRVLLIGGSSLHLGAGLPSNLVDIYSPITKTTAPGAPMNIARAYHTATTLLDGRVLVTGGTNGSAVLSSAELFDPSTNTWTLVAGAMTSPREQHRAILVPDYGVLLVGGGTGSTVLASTEIFSKATLTFIAAASMSSVRLSPVAASLDPANDVLVAGGSPISTMTAERFHSTAAPFVPPAVTPVNPGACRIQIAAPALIPVRVNTAVSAGFSTVAGSTSGNVLYALDGGSLPTGVSFTSAGAMTGTPATTGFSTFTVKGTEVATGCAVTSDPITLAVYGGAVRSNAGFASTLLTGTTLAETPLAGRCDDCSSLFTFPATFRPRLFGATRSAVYVNNNGNVSFNSFYVGTGADQFPLPALGTTSTTQRPILAPFLADVDTRNTTTLTGIRLSPDYTTFGMDTVNGHAAFGVNWFSVGRFNQDESVRNTFQLVVIDRSDLGTGRVEVEYNYDDIQWTHTTAQAVEKTQVGWDAGDGLSRYNVPDTFSDTDPVADVTNDDGLQRLPFRSTNSSEPGRVDILFPACSIYLPTPDQTEVTPGTAWTRTFAAQLGQPAITYAVTGALPTGATFTTTTGVLLGAATNATTGVFPLTVTATDANGCIASTPYTLIVSSAAPTVTLSDLTQTYTGSPLFPTATTTPPGLPVFLSYNNGSLVTAPTAAGTYQVSAAIQHPLYHGSAIGSFVINKASATVALSGLSQNFDGTPKSATALTTPSGLPVTLTYNGSTTPPTAAASYTLVGTVNSPLYAGSSSGTFVIAASCGLVVVNPAPSVARLGAVMSSATFTTTGATGTKTFTLESGTLPPGVTLSSAGVLTGTPTATGTYSIVVRSTITPGGCTTLSAPYSIKVYGPLRTQPGLSSITNGFVDSHAVDLGAAGWPTLQLFGQPFSHLVVNRNGAVTLNGALPATTAYLSLPIDSATVGAVFAAHLGDVLPAQVRGNTVTWGFDVVDGHRAFGVTWSDSGQRFQFVLIQREDLAAGSFDVEYNYDQTLWLAQSSGGGSIGWEGGLNAPFFDWTSGKTDADALALPVTSYGSTELGRFRFPFYVCSVAAPQPQRQEITSGVAFSRSFVPSTGGPYTVTLTSGLLPAGLTLTNGVLAGTPALGVRSLFELAITDASGCSVTAAYDLSVVPPPTILLTPLFASPFYDGLPKALSGAIVPAAPGAPPVTISYNGGMTPPTLPGTYAIVATAPGATTAVSSLTVLPAVPSIVLSNLTQAYDGALKAPTVTTVPAGLKTTVTYQGATPITVGSYPFTVTATDSDFSPLYLGQQNGTLVIQGQGCGVNTIALPAQTRAHAGFAVSLPFTVAGGASATFVLATGTLPTGMTLSSAGVLSGTPTVKGSYPITVKATLAVGGCVLTSQTYTLVVSTPIRSNVGFTQNAFTAPGVIDPNGGTDSVGRCDDCSKLVQLPWAMNLNGINYTSLYVNNNGNVSFQQPLGTWIGGSFPQNLGIGPILAPYFGDVDTRLTTTWVVNGVAQPADWTTWGFDVVDGHRAFGVNWLGVGYYSGHEDKRNSFQMVVIERKDLGEGAFDLEYNYDAVTWLSGDASPNALPSVGYDLGDNINYFNFAGTLTNAVLSLPTADPDPLYPDREIGRLPFYFRPSCTAPGTPAAIQLSGVINAPLSYPADPTQSTLVRIAIKNGDLPRGMVLNVDGSLSGTPLEAGDFSITLSSIGGGCESAGGIYNIHVAKMQTTVLLSNLVFNYDGLPKAPTATTFPAGLNVQLTYNGSNVTPVNGGVYFVAAVIVDDLYQGADARTLIIHRPATIQLQPLVALYSGTPVAAANATTVPAGLAVTYTYDGSSSTPINAGTHTVVATINDPAWTGTATANYIIIPATATVTVSNLTQTYDGTQKRPTVVTTPAGLPTTVSFQGLAAAPRQSGTYAFTVSTSDPNYTIAPTLYVLTINPVAVTVTLSNLTGTYNAGIRLVTAATSPALPVGASVTITYDGSPVPPVPAGSYSVVATVVDPNGNYTGTTTGTFVTSKAAATVATATIVKNYGAADPTFNATLLGFMAADNIVATVSRAPGETVAGGPYPITATLSPAAALVNYTITTNTGVLNILKATASVTPAAATKVYGSADPAFTGTLTGFLASDNIVASYTRTTGEAVASSYTISASLSPAAAVANYTIASNTAAFTITKKAASVTPNAATKIYGDGDPTLSGSLSGFLPADNVVASYSRTAGETVAGTYTVGATLASTPAAALANYTITSNTAAFTITKKAALVTIDAATKIYGDADPAFSAILSGFLPGDQVTGTYFRSMGENVGNGYRIDRDLHAIPQTALANYDITTTLGVFTITPKAASVTPNAATKIYGSTDPAFSGTLSGFLAGDHVTATYSRAAGESVAAGPYPISAALAPAPVLTNYTITANAAALTITPKTASVTPNAATKLYGGTDPSLSGTLTGFLAGDSVTAAYSRLAGETVSGGPYAISAVLTPAAVLTNYAITSNTAAFTITPKSASVTPNAATKIYGDADPALSGTLAGFLPADNVVATYSRTAGSTVTGPYTISAALTPAAVLTNYAITSNTAAFTITPKTASVTPNAATKIYGDADPALSGTLAGFLPADNVVASYSRTAGSMVTGSYTISATLTPAALLTNYAITSNTAAFTITPKAASVTPNAATKIYGGGDPAFSGALSGFLAGDSVVAAYSRTAGETVGSSPYTISAALTPAGVLTNYAITSNTAAFTITPKAASVTPNPATKIYGGADPALSGTLSGFLAADSVGATYSRTTGETVGGNPYTISAVLSPAGVLGNYDLTSNTAAFTISPKPASVTPAAASKTYGTADPALTGALSGFLAADNVTASYSRTGGETVAGGPYTISAVLSPAGVLSNYTLTSNTAVFTIDKANASVTPAAASKTYGTSDPVLSGALSGFIAGDGVTAAYSRLPGETVAGGPYTISAVLSPAGVLANYNLTSNTAVLTINRAIASVTPAAASKTYGTADPSLTGSLSGFTAADAVTATYSRTAGETVASGPYTISAVLAPAGVLDNYTITAHTAAFTINKAIASVTPAAASKTYGTSDPSLTGTLSGFVAADSVTAAYSRTAGESVASSPYTISAALSPATVLDNYTITSNTAVFTINKATASVTPAPASKTYGAADPSLTGSLSGFVAGDGVTAAYTRTAGETVSGGPYSISAALSPAGVLGNYDITSNTAAFTIARAPLTVVADAKTKTYGAVNPALSGVVTGIQHADPLTASYTTSATGASPAGDYLITPSIAGAELSNYDLTLTDGHLTISRAQLTVTADSHSKVYGAALPPLTASYAGFVNGDTFASLTAQPALTTVGTAASAAGSYPITAAGAASSNYDIAYVAGTLSVTKALVTITADNQSKVYGAALPALTASYAGFVNGDTVTSLTSPATLTTPATASSAVGTYGIAAGGATSPNYDITYIRGQLTVSKATVTIAADNQSKIYGAALPSLTASYSGFVNGDTFANLATPVTLTTAATAASAAGSYPITASGAASPNYDIAYTAGTLSVAKAQVTITADNQSKVYGAPLPPLTASYAGFVNGDTSASLTAQPALNTAGTAASTAGSYPITAAGALSPNYDIAYAAGTLSVTKALITITADDQAKVYGAALPALTASYTGFVNGDTVASLTPAATLTTPATASSAVGTYGIAAGGASSPNYEITYRRGQLTVSKATVTITADNQSKVYGAALPSLTASYAGFVNGDTFASLTTPVTLTTAATAASAAGSYPITAAGAASPNYDIAYVAGSLSVTRAAIVITADSQTKVYGAALPPLTASYSGFVNGDASTSLTAQPTLTTTGTAASTAGSYPITAAGAMSPNYDITYAGGSLTVTKALVVITADNQSKMYGAALPAFTASYSGFVNGDNAASLTTLPTFTTAATTSSPAGTYGIAAGGAASPNYDITYIRGQLTVSKATVTITADSQSKVYGAALPALTASYSGFVNGDSTASLATPVSLSTTATAASGIGSYPITASGASSANYDIVYVPGSLNVSKALITVTADSLTKVYGAALPPLTASYAGFVNGDSVASLVSVATLTTAATASSAAGSYGIAAGGVSSPNYDVTYVRGTLTVGKVVLTVTADAKTKVYRDALPPLTASYSGFVNGDTAGSLSAPAVLQTTAQVTSGVGSYPITASGAASANYTISYVAGTLLVTPAAATVTASSASKVYGAADPAFTATAAGFSAADGITVSATRAAGTAAGSYATTATASGANVGNYAVTYVAGALTITKAPLTVKANDATKRPGDPLPAFTAAYTGFVIGETASVLGGTLTFTTSATAASAAGTYPVTPSGLTSSNYAITFTAGTLTVANTAPTATKDAYATQWNTTLTVAAATGLLANDTDANHDALTAVKVTSPSHGTLTLNANGSFSYKPSANYAGSDSFTYKASDGLLTSAVVTVKFTITSPCRADDDDWDEDDSWRMDWDDCRSGTPDSNNDKYQTLKNKALTVAASSSVLRNDGRYAATAELYTAPLHGTVVLAANGSFVYTPAANYTGSDVFYYVPRSSTGIAGAVTSVSLKISGHSDGDNCDHDRHRNGHHDNDGCEHDHGGRGDDWDGRW